MGKLVQSVLWTLVFTVQPLFAQEKAKTDPPPGRGGIATFFSELEWWFYVLIIGLVVLIGVYVYLRKKQQED